jgi:hypothetical protein
MFTMRHMFDYSVETSDLPCLLMAANLTGHRSGRATHIYNSEERSKIDIFKPQYLEATSPAARKTIAQVHIFPALFNYWTSIGHIIDDHAMRVRSAVCRSFKIRVCSNIKSPMIRLYLLGSGMSGVVRKRPEKQRGQHTGSLMLSGGR